LSLFLIELLQSKLFLSIPEEQSKTILKSIIKEKDRWSFKYKKLIFNEEIKWDIIVQEI